MVKKYRDFLLEYKKSDVEFIKSIGDKFTVAVEYELCANEDPEEEPGIDDYDKAMKYVIETTILNLKRKISWGTKISKPMEEIEEFIRDIMEEVIDLYYEGEEDEVYDELLNPEMYDDPDEKFIIEALAANSMKFLETQNMDYLKDRVKENLPNFWKKYNRTFKYELEGDPEKQRIIEFSPKKYVEGLDNGIQQLNDFFDDFEKQYYWYFNNRTALHLNVGMKNMKLNPIKGLMILSDYNRDKKIPFVFKGIEHRLENIHVGSMIDKLRDLLSNKLKKEKGDQRQWKKLKKYPFYLQKNLDKLDLHNIKQTEDFLNELMLNVNLDFWVKEFGLNITQYKNNYVEFRFVGGDIKRDLIIEKLQYFAYIVYAMADPEYKRESYTKRLYKFVEELKDLVK